MSAEKPNEWQARRWRLLTEAAVIVVSILIAFGIDALWDSRKDQVLTRAYLEQLSEQMASTRLTLQTSREQMEGAMVVQRAFTLAIRPSPELISADSVDALHGRSMQFGASSVVRGTLDAVVSQGDLSESLPPEVVGRLVRFAAGAVFYEKEGDIAEEVRERFLDRYMELAPTGYAVGASDPLTDFPLDVALVLSDMRLESRLTNLTIRLSRVARASGYLEALSDSIVSDLRPGAI